MAMALVTVSFLLLMFCPGESGVLKQACLMSAIGLPLLAVAVGVMARMK